MKSINERKQVDVGKNMSVLYMLAISTGPKPWNWHGTSDHKESRQFILCSASIA